MSETGGHIPKLREYLDASGVLVNGTEEEIKAARRTHRKLYQTAYKRKQRKEKPEFAVHLSHENGEYNRISSAARKSKMSVQQFLKSATLAYISKTFLVPDRELIANLAGLLSDCLNEVEQIARTKTANSWQLAEKYESIEKRIADLDMKITRLFTDPPEIEEAVRSAIEKDSELRLRLLMLLTSAPHEPHADRKSTRLNSS